MEKKSEFIAQLAPVNTEQAALDFLAGVRRTHHAARHNVYAFRLHGGAARQSDDGEPAKTAGAPVMAALQHAGLYNCIVVVTRYFGGTLLGTGGLARAYGAAASAAVAAAGALVMQPVCTLTARLPYPLYEKALRIIGDTGGLLQGQPEFTDEVHLSVLLRAADAPRCEAALHQLLRGDDAALSLSAATFAPFGNGSTE